MQLCNGGDLGGRRAVLQHLHRALKNRVGLLQILEHLLLAETHACGHGKTTRRTAVS